MKELTTIKPFEIRFSEVDSMGVVWHGHYMLYFEDAREAFGAEHGLGYMTFIDNKCYAPIVETTFNYKRPLTYGMHPEIKITYRPTEAAKIVFDYEIRDIQTGEIYTTGHSVQVFMDLQYQLLWTNPAFYEAWKEAHLK